MPTQVGRGGRPYPVTGYGRNYTSYGYDSAMCAAADVMGCPPTQALTTVNYTSGILTVSSRSSLTTAGVPTGNITGSGTALDPYIVTGIEFALTAGNLKIAMNYIQFQFCKIHTSWFGTTDSGVIDCASTSISHAPGMVTFYKCDIYLDSPSYWLDGILGHGFTLSYCNVYHTCDGVGSQVAFGSGQQVAGITIDHCWIHDLCYFNGKFVPMSNYSGGGGSPGNGSSGGYYGSGVVNPYGNPEKPDGSHNDCWQPQNGSTNVCQYSILDGRLDATQNGSGVALWLRYGTNDLTTAAGNSYGPPWGTYNTNSAIQFNNVTQTAPVTGNTVLNNWFLGGREAMVNIAQDAWDGPTGTYTGSVFEGNIFCDDIGPSGCTTPPQGLTGLSAVTNGGPGFYGFNASGTAYTAFQLTSETAGWAIILSANYTSQFAISSSNPNILHSTGAAVPWNNPSSPYRTG